MSKLKPSDKQRLEVMKWFTTEIIEFNKGKVFEDFQKTSQLNFATVFAIEQISENSKHISEDVKNRHDSFPWREIVDIRNVIAHNYDGVHMDLVWDVVQNHLPELVDQIDEILKNDLVLSQEDGLSENQYKFNNIPIFKNKDY